MTTTTATFCATLVDEWVRAGISDAFVAPGSRSTPLTLALVNDDRIRTHVFHDERSAAFAALGHGLATDTPAVVVATSGTAAAHFHAAVIEASQSSVPLLVCTTDRPPELQGIGAPQTIDQVKLYGSAVRHFEQPGVPDGAMSGAWRSLGSRLVAEARGSSGEPGPVHVNLGFRDPLVGDAGELPPGRANGAPWHLDARGPLYGSECSQGEVTEVWNRIRGLDGLIVAGAGTTEPSAVLSLAQKLGWPVIADHRSGCRAEGRAVVHADALLRIDAFTQANPVDVVLRFGRPLSSKALSQWMTATKPEVIIASPPGRWDDPERLGALTVTEEGLARGLTNHLPSDYRPSDIARQWLHADVAAQQLVAEMIDGAGPGKPLDGVTEIGVARHVVANLKAGGALVVASSMPIRDVEWFGPNRRNIKVFANRGANGIDGVISTAVGVALTGVSTTLLVGDVAFLHDSSALIALAKRRIDLTIVVIDNNGGGIFSFLPQAGAVQSAVFEKLFGTPHGTDIVGLCTAHGIPAISWAPGDETPGAVGVRVLVAKTDRAENVRVHDKVNAAIAKAVSE
ncbi:MAG: 2-succinyl-5-enolpyruvyl-6-hydroxy-3-cyclohexene-1-carboxylic-acid synthase [Acidimicrobiia bacterium]|nr:2-succinyl-5-enolpyruvyl-6-hydroxy-3-cyclohexene-1-carboxylic-acid synthase [Acidimicrobiia bacterium]